MGDKNQLKTVDEVCECLEFSQEMIEIAAFEAINQQDKVANAICAGMSNIEELLTKIEVASMEFEETIMNVMNSNCEIASDMLSEIYSAVQQIAGQYQELCEQQQALSEIVHNMEDKIAIHRDSMELAEEILYQLENKK